MSLLSLALSLVFLALSFLAPNTLTAFLGLGALGWPPSPGSSPGYGR